MSTLAPGPYEAALRPRPMPRLGLHQYVQALALQRKGLTLSEISTLLSVPRQAVIASLFSERFTW